MNGLTKAGQELAGNAVPSSNTRATRPFAWSVRREVWENCSIYVAPLVVAGVLLCGAVVTAFHLPELRRKALSLDPEHQRAAIEAPYEMAAMVLILTAFVVGFFYCLDALFGERRDRSILFWKSLPVSDLTTVMAKASVPLLVLPVVTFAVTVLTQFVMLLLSTVALTSSGLAATTWANFNLLQHSLILLYSLAVMTLWHAPIYGWLLLVSGWARRAAFLWAMLPIFAISIFEKIALHTSYFSGFVQGRVIGFLPVAFLGDHAHPRINSLAQLTTGRYLSSPGLWIGLAVFVAFIALAVRLRRYRGPI